MNRIEKVATPTPAQQPQPRLPRQAPNADRPTIPGRRQPTGASPRNRRGSSGLAVAIAALAVPLMPSPALGAVASTGSMHKAPQYRHHMPHRDVLPVPGVLTVQTWATASGWTITVPYRPGLPWPTEVVSPIDRRPVVLPDGTHGEISAYRVSRVNPQGENPGAPGARTPGDPGGPDGSVSSTPSLPSGDGPPEWSSGGPSALRTARARIVLAPLIPKQAVATDAVIGTSPSPCMGAAYPAGNDRFMQVHLRPASDAMDVAVTPHRTACAARVDYLSQARA